MSARVYLSLIFATATTAAYAQAPAQTGTGGGPTSTITAPNTSAVGQTKPPGSAGGPISPDQRTSEGRDRSKNDAIETGICIGCNK